MIAINFTISVNTIMNRKLLLLREESTVDVVVLHHDTCNERIKATQ